MKKINKHFTPDRITELSRCEIFVFGSNNEGQHNWGAARIAYEKFGAEWGVGNGRTGKCYAIPSMNGELEKIKPFVDEFIEYAKQYPNNRFLLTRIGCGIADFKDEDMAPLFEKCLNLPNVTIPRDWIATILVGPMIDNQYEIRKVEEPKALTEDTLLHICQKYRYQIGAGITCEMPIVNVRYIIDNDQFGYACFGNYFFYGNDFYVWDLDDKWADEHNEAVVMDFFHDECFGRGYAHKMIFAGVRTNFVDAYRKHIYSGDVVKVDDREGKNLYHLALGAFANEEGKGDYRFILDNHSLLISDCIDKKYKLTRIGTIFYQLEKDQSPGTINSQSSAFNLNLMTGNHKQIELLKAQYTPNFNKEEWKYIALKNLDIEYNWNR